MSERPGPAASPAYVFLLGLEDRPTDALEDHAGMLIEELQRRGKQARSLRVRWDRDGWPAALEDLRAQVDPGDILILQYTSPQWQRRYGPVGAWSTAKVARKAGARFALVIHDPFAPDFGPALRSRAVGGFERLLMRVLVRSADAAVVSVDPSLLPWGYGRSVLLPSGTNVLPTSSLRKTGTGFTIAAFSFGGRTDREALAVAACIRATASRIRGLRLSVFGRYAETAGPILQQELRDSDVELSIEGVLPAHDVSDRLAEADVLLFVRDSVSSRHGTIAAAIAHGLPVVGYRGRETGPPITEAGVMLADVGDAEGIADAIARVASDPALAEELRGRSRAAHERWFSWDRAAQILLAALPED